MSKRGRVVGVLLAVVAGCGGASEIDAGVPLDGGGFDVPPTGDDVGTSTGDIDHEQGCVATAACRTGGSSTNVELCVRHASTMGGEHLPATTEQIACAARAGTDCDAIRACEGETERPASGTCTERCEGNSTVSCVGEIERLYDCTFGDPDNRCEEDFGTPRCVSDECGAARTCEDGELVSCTRGRRMIGCNDGTSCVIVDGEGVCLGTGSACTEDGCDGDMLLRCAEGRVGVRIDCTAFDARCAVGSEGATCAPTNDDCELSRCEGDVLVYCRADGTERRYDCVARGWANCELSSSGPTCRP